MISVAQRPFRAAGKDYVRGDRVDLTGYPVEAAMLRTGYLKPLDPQPADPIVAAVASMALKKSSHSSRGRKKKWLRAGE